MSISVNDYSNKGNISLGKEKAVPPTQDHIFPTMNIVLNRLLLSVEVKLWNIYKNIV